MGKKNKKKNRKKAKSSTDSPTYTWMGEEGVHVMMPGTQPSPGQVDEMTMMFQDNIRNSPIWNEMVKEFGLEKAEELLKQCRAKPG